MTDKKTDKIEIFNINTPGKSTFVQRKFYEEMRRAVLKMLPSDSPGMTQAEMMSGIPAFLSEKIFPGAEKSGWWLKGVQLDLEARNMIVRVPGKPIRWHKNTDTAEVIPVRTVESNSVRRPEHEMPGDILTLLEDKQLIEDYNLRPYYQRNDYLGWILSAKREDTRARRIEQMLEELRDGDRYMKMPYKVRKG